ncbi:hypothetical protein [Limnobacter sp.]|uniref:hypothetical protein n=1 Tax=Limnobacter sp. TaxID=2003368 RepID=UPI00311F32C8
MPTADEILKGINSPELKEGEKDSSVSTTLSVLAGIGSGLIKIPQGFASLGATIMDLGGDTKYALEVEKFFDELNPFDEYAQKTGAGKLVEVFTNLAIPGGFAFKLADKAAKAALTAKKAGTYFQLNNPNLVKGAQKAIELNKKGKAVQFAAGAAGAGIGDAMFVANVEDVGTFGDLLGGPTQLERDEEYDATRELINRVKFGTEGALFSSVIGGVGKTIGLLSKRGKELRYSNSKIDQYLDKFASGFRSRGSKTQEFFDLERQQIGARSADVNFAQEVARGLDKNIDAIFPPLKTIFNKQVANQRTQTLKELNDALLSGKPAVNNAGEVVFGEINQTLKNNLASKFKKLGANQENIDGIFNGLNSIRKGWGEMFSALGQRLDDTKLTEFKQLFGNKFQSYLGSTYDIFQNKSLLPWVNYKPTEEVINKAKDMFKTAALKNGKKLTDEQANFYVERLIKTARMPKGFRMDKPSDPLFEIPEFFVGKTVLDDAVTQRGYISLSALPKEQQAVIKEVLGETKNPMQTILGGTGRLSLITRRNEFFDNLLKSSDELKDSGKRGMFYETRDEATLALGPNIKQVNIDPNRALEAGITNPLNGKWAITELADALAETAAMSRSNSTAAKIYESLILYPKATSQIAKTILSPFTHVRNLISAGAFATANGIVPTPSAMKEAYSALQIGLKGAQTQNELYRKLLKLGVVNSNVRLGDLTRLLEDVRFGETLTSDKALRGLLKPLSKLKSFAQDAYTAEDDFWKITSWAVERDRLNKAYTKYGIKRTLDQLDEEAASIVRNNIPNYDYVSNFVKGLRKFPIGNFVSFPAEIMRTSANIVKRALDEIGYEVTLANGKTVKPLANIGYQRLIGMGVTTAVVPAATADMFKALYNVTEDEMNAIRRYVADWSKNSTILPIRSKEGKLKYIDFSHINAYDTLAKPFESVAIAISQGAKNKDGIMDDFLRGMFNATKEIANPFISEAIWTEAATDILIRGGRTRDGVQVFNPQDTPGAKTQKIIKHLIESQAPFNYRQLERLDLAIKPIDILQKGKFDKYGQTYELGDELAGIAGFRAVAVNPERTFDFKIADFQKGVRDSRQLFTRETLRGGPVTPKQIVDAYIDANRALFGVKKNLYEDMKAARILGLEENKIINAMKDRASLKTYAAIDSGRFRPLNISKDVMRVFQENADKLGVENPFFAAQDALFKIKFDLMNVPLTEETIPNFINPFDNMPEPKVPNIQGTLPPLPNPQVMNQFGQIPSQIGSLTTQQQFASLFPNDTIGNLIAQRKTT